MDVNQIVRLLKKQNDQQAAQMALMSQQISELKSADHDPRKDLNRIQGRRIAYFLTGNQVFTAADDGARGSPINMLVAQDGPFIMTHFPVVMWRANLPTNATDFGRWRPVYDWPMPSQELSTNFISISWELQDGGSQRNMQNESLPPMFSSPTRMHKLPEPTYFAPNSSVSFIPTYEDITFEGSEATTSGILKVSLPGFKIVNM